MLSKLQIAIGSLLLLIATLVAAFATIVSLPAALVNPFVGEALIDNILLFAVWSTPILLGFGTLGGFAGVIFLFINPERTWRVAAAAGAIVLPHSIFFLISVLTSTGTLGVGGLGGYLISDANAIINVLTYVMYGFIAVPLIFWGAAFFVNSSLVREDKEIWDAKDKYTRGMNIMDPSVQKELEDARKEHEGKG